MRYICSNCNYIYDESMGDKQENISPWTYFDKLWDYFSCPVCWELGDSFSPIKEEVNYLEAWKPLDFVEKEHFIDIKLQNDILKVQVWNPSHPMWEDHKITEISLYDEYGDIIETVFLNFWEEPKAEFDISFIDEFEVRARCSLHWLWGRKVSRN